MYNGLFFSLINFFLKFDSENRFLFRKEGELIGKENNLSGWENACFWFGQTDYHPAFPRVNL